MPRAQCLVLRGDRILMVLHRDARMEWWCLPGGGINPGEAPDAAALRELKEECCVDGTLIKPTSIVEYGPEDHHYTYLVEIGDQTPVLGDDPEKAADKKILADLGWMLLEDLSEADRVYLWGAGLLTVPRFVAMVETWDRSPSIPGVKRVSSGGV